MRHVLECENLVEETLVLNRNLHVGHSKLQGFRPTLHVAWLLFVQLEGGASAKAGFFAWHQKRNEEHRRMKWLVKKRASGCLRSCEGPGTAGLGFF